jgi:O-antigen biosynthesis protein
MADRGIFKMRVPQHDLEFTGERFTTAIDGEIRHEHLHRYFFALQFCRDKAVLDVAAGEGYGAALLSAVASRVIGVDKSAEVVRHANLNYCDSHTFFQVGAAEELPFADNSVDVVVSFETLEHLSDQEKFLRELKRVLRPDGLLVISSPDKAIYSGEKAIANPYHVKELSRADFKALLSRYFRQTAFFAQGSLMGSVITPDRQEARAVEHEGFRRLYDTCFEVAQSLPAGTYLLCVASDGVLPPIRVGSFDDRPFQLGLYAELQRRHEQIFRHLAEINHLKDQVEANKTLGSELEAAQCALADVTGQLKQARRDLEIVERTSREHQLAHEATQQATEQHIQKRDCELQAAPHDVLELTSQLELTQHSLEDAEDILRKREVALEVAQRALLESTAELRQMQQNLQAVQPLLQDRESVLGDVQSALLESTDQLSQARKDPDTAERKSREHECELQTAQRSVSELTARLDELREIIDNVEEASASREAQILSLRNSLSALNAQLAEARLTRTGLESELTQDRTSLQEIDAKISHLHESLSWRLTKPLRYSVDLLHSVRALFIRGLYGSSRLCGVGKTLAKLIYVWGLPGGRFLLPDRTLFLDEFYAKSNPDTNPHHDLWAHYIAFGAEEGRNPHPMFDSRFYLAIYPDVASSGLNPLVHYILYGGREKRRPHRGFDPVFYLHQRPDVGHAGMNPLLHYWKHGKNEGTAPAPRLLGAARTADCSVSSALGTRSAAQRRGEAPNRSESDETAGPLISILVPTFNTPHDLLRTTLESVLRQTYPNWQLCIYDDGSSRDDTRAVLDDYSRMGNPRILVEYGRSNQGISRASNAALAMAKGQFTGMLDHDDELELDALQQIVARLSLDPSLDVVYTDQDYVDPEGHRSGTLFKPDWSPEMFCGVMFVNHFLVVRTNLMRRLGGFDPAFDGLQDFDFMLRVSEATPRIAHIPQILYHWRQIPGSVAHNANSKGQLEPRQAAAVNAHLSRCGIHANARPHPSLSHRLTIHPRERLTFPRVAIVVRAAQQEAASKALQSIFELSTYPNIIIYVPPTLAKSRLDDRRVVAGHREEISSQIEREDFLVWVDSDLELLSPDWLQVLLMYCEQPAVACASPLIVDSTNTVWSSGLVLGMDAGIGFPMRGWPADSDGYAGSLSCSREVSAVSGECMMISGPLFRRLGGSIRYYSSTTFDGADLSLRATTIQHRNIVTPQVRMRKTGSSSVSAEWPLDQSLFIDRWRDLIRQGDHFYNPHFSRSAPGYITDNAVLGAPA